MSRDFITSAVLEQLGFPTREDAEAETNARDNPNVKSIRQLVDGSWAVAWEHGGVTGRNGRRLAPEQVQWAPDHVLTLGIHVSDDLRRQVARLVPCRRELADDAEVSRWLVDAVAQQLAALEAT